MHLDEISYAIRKAAYEVHNHLGPGLFESVYEAAMAYEMNKQGLRVRSQIPIPVYYKEARLDIGFRLDLLVEETVIVEIKSAEMVSNVHRKQLLTYLRLTNTKLGILINFNDVSLIDKKSLIRVIN